MIVPAEVPLAKTSCDPTIAAVQVTLVPETVVVDCEALPELYCEGGIGPIRLRITELIRNRERPFNTRTGFRPLL